MKTKSKYFNGAVVFFAVILLVIGLGSVAKAQTVTPAQSSVQVSADFVNAPSNAILSVKVSCIRLNGSPSIVQNVSYSSTSLFSSTLFFPVEAPSVSNPNGTNCRVDAQVSPWNATVTLKAASLTHTGVAGVNSESSVYKNGYFPVFASTEFDFTVTYPSVNVNVTSVNNGKGLYQLNCLDSNGATVIVQGTTSKVWTLTDIPGLFPGSKCSLTVLSGDRPSLVAQNNIVSGSTVNLIFTGDAPVTTTSTSTTVPVTTSSVAVTTVAPTTTLKPIDLTGIPTGPPPVAIPVAVDHISFAG